MKKRTHPSADLVRAALHAEERVRRYQPKLPGDDEPREPHCAEQVLAALAAKYRPGDTIGLRHVIETIAITWEQARAIRTWAISQGAWPYLQPAPGRPPGPSPRRKVGDS